MDVGHTSLLLAVLELVLSVHHLQLLNVVGGVFYEVHLLEEELVDLGEALQLILGVFVHLSLLLVAFLGRLLSQFGLVEEFPQILISSHIVLHDLDKLFTLPLNDSRGHLDWPLPLLHVVAKPPHNLS